MDLTKEQQQIFAAKGFVVLKGFFDKNIIDDISTWLDELEVDAGSSSHAAR